MKIQYEVVFISTSGPDRTVIYDRLPSDEELRNHKFADNLFFVRIVRKADGEALERHVDPMTRIYFQGTIVTEQKQVNTCNSIKEYGMAIYLEKNNSNYWFNPKKDRRV